MGEDQETTHRQGPRERLLGNQEKIKAELAAQQRDGDVLDRFFVTPTGQEIYEIFLRYSNPLASDVAFSAMGSDTFLTGVNIGRSSVMRNIVSLLDKKVYAQLIKNSSLHNSKEGA